MQQQVFATPLRRALGGLGLSLQVEGDVRGWLRQGLLQVVLPQWALPAV